MRHYFLLLLCSFLCINLYSQAVLPKPDKYYSVVDKASLLKPDELATLTTKLDAFKQQTENELVVVIISSLNGLNIEEYSNRLFNEWGIGKAKYNNGILLLIAVDNKKMRIETGYGVEDKLTDSKASTILDVVITPEFRQQQFFNGIDKATNTIISQVSPDFEMTKYSSKGIYNFEESKKEESSKTNFSPWFLFFLTFTLQLIFGFSLVFITKFNNVKKEKSDVSLVSLTSFLFCIITLPSNLFDMDNELHLIVYIVMTIIAILIYVFATVKNFLSLFVAAFVSFFISMMIYSFTKIILLFFAAEILFTIILFYLFRNINFNSGSSGYSSSSENSSSYSSSYSSSSSSGGNSGYSNSSYGGGKSGGGGASGSW